MQECLSKRPILPAKETYNLGKETYSWTAM